MQSIRVQPILQGEMLLDVVCDCGTNGLTNKATGEATFKHLIELGANTMMVLVCDMCQSEYAIVAQGDHIHVINKIPPIDERFLFYEGTKYFLSNFSSFKVQWRGIDWMTSEHAYQAAKFDDPEIVDLIKNAPSAHDAKKIAEAHVNKEIGNWSEMRVGVMEEILRAKLAQHPYIQRKLRESGQREIVENSPTDSFWGRGPDWKGQNWLGKLWMKLRGEL
jgi:N-glycosidase YbiA